MTSNSSSSLGIDTTVPSTARMYDFWFGGHDNFAADRAAALKVSEAAPEAQLMAVENRGFLRRQCATWPPAPESLSSCALRQPSTEEDTPHVDVDSNVTPVHVSYRHA